MKHRAIIARVVLVTMLATLLMLSLFACKPVDNVNAEKYPIIDDDKNQINKDHTTKDEAINRTCDAMENLLDYLDSDIVSTTGYYVGSDIVINTENGSAFILKLKANLYTYPYELKDENGNVVLDKDGKPMVDKDKLAIHNRLIKQNDIVLEWYDGMTNKMLIGFYFDGTNPNSADPGNNLYLNLQGSKRIFPNFGDSVLYQQMVRLITKFNLAAVMGSAAGGTATDAVDTIRDLLNVAVDKNYKKTINDDIDSIYYNDVSLSMVADDITSYVQSFFGPFKDKIDPLTKKYLGFKFSTLGNTTIESLGSNMQYFISPASTETLNKEILSGVVVDLIDGQSTVIDKNNVRTPVPFTARIAANYSIRTSSDIVIDKKDYKMYKYGNYEYVGDLFIPMLDLKMDALIRTDVNDYDNKLNRVYSAFRDKADDKLLIGGYYANEKTYIDITGLKNLYGGIKFEDIGLPKAYKEGFNLAELLKWVFDTIDIYLVYMVDDLLSPSEGSGYDNLTSIIISKMESTEKTDDDPTSRNTVSIRIDIELIRAILKETSTNGTVFTNEQMIDIINDMFNIDLNEIAAILGVDINDLMNNTEFKITFDVDSSGIKLEVFYHQETVLILDLLPVKIGEEVMIVFPSFKDFKPLQKVMTYSGYLEGQFIFAATEEVDLSTLMGAFIADESGLNTHYILPDAADIYFTMYYDQYIREQILANGRWTRSGRSAFNLHFYTVVGNERRDLFRVYANDVCFNTAKSIEEFGYVWVDLICVEGMPKLKIREDLFIESFSRYMGQDITDGTVITGGLTVLVRALMEDSWPTFEPDVIRITTSNQSIKDFFKVDELIGTVSVQIGFRQRVFNIDELEVGFAMYYVGEFSDISGNSPYEITLHKTIAVYFDYGDRTIVKEMLVDYDKASINVVTGLYYYYPTLANRFMGVTRDYTVSLAVDAKGRSRIDALQYDSVVWEPLQDLPTVVTASYGGDKAQIGTYKADYNFFATYDKSLDYYVVQNDYGYDILYDLKNDTYIVGLGANFKMNKIYKVLPENAKIFRKDYINDLDVKMLYDIKSGYYGYYTVRNDKCNIIYNFIKDEYIIKNESDRLNAQMVVGEAAKIIALNSVIEVPQSARSINVKYDFYTGYFVVEQEGMQYLYYETTVKDEKVANFIVNDDNTYNYVGGEYPAAKVSRADASIKWNSVNWNKNLDYFNQFDLEHKRWDTIDWTPISWDEMTLNGGIYIVNVVIGAGKMATFEQHIKLKVTNREVETDQYVNINAEGIGKIKAPVVNTKVDIKVDPYAYMLLKADFINNIHNGVVDVNFVREFFKKYQVAINFTEIYGDSNDTPSAIGNYEWRFDAQNSSRIYSESDINNFVQNGSESVTYLYTIFQRQVVALAIKVQPRTIDHIQFSGEKNPNEYTVDSLLPETYNIPKFPVIYFKETDASGAQYTLNFADFANSSIFKDMLMTPSAKFGSGAVNSALPIARQSVINWSNPTADNVKLNWNGQDVKPFKKSQTNVTTSFIDIKSFVDPNNVWFNADWFATPIVSVTVLMPDKVVDELTKVYDGVTYTYSDIVAQSGSGVGIFNVDPYNMSGWKLPTTITINFNNGDGNKYSKDYAVQWQEDSNVEMKDGAFFLKSVQNVARSYFVVTTKIGNEEIGTIAIKLLICNLSGNVSTFEFLDGSHNNLAGGLNSAPYVVNVGGTDYTTYKYNVDTYSRFEIPSFIKVKFDDGDIRTYDTDFASFPAWVQGQTYIVNTKLGGGSQLTKDVPLAFVTEAREIQSMLYSNENSTIADVTTNLTTRAITIEVGAINGDNVSGTARNLYDYILYVLSDIRLAFVSDSVQFGRNVVVTDAATSAIKAIYERFDMQKMLDAEGQSFVIYVGQGKAADDFTVTVKVTTGAKITSGKISAQTIMPYEITDAGAVPKYKDGYIISDNFNVSVMYGATERIFGGEAFKDWVVGKPALTPTEINELPAALKSAYNSDRDSEMSGINTGDKLVKIDWATLLKGGYCWISAMLPDSSRVYIRLNIGGINIGSNYRTPDDYRGKFPIKDGTITVSDIYSVFPLSDTLTLAALPTTIYAQGIAIPSIQWVLDPQIDYAFLSTLNYTSQVTFKLAEAKVMDETINLYMTIEPSRIASLTYDTDIDKTKNFEISSKKFDFDVYRNKGYSGNFVLPQNVTFRFETSKTHAAQAVNYMYCDNKGVYRTIAAIPYDYKGHLLTDTSSNATLAMRIIMADGQQFDFVINFPNKTVSSVSVKDFNGNYGVGSLNLDPYGTERTVNKNVRVTFADGSTFDYTVGVWSGDYEVKYNTYREKLKGKTEFYSLQSTLNSNGITAQDLNLKVYILDRVVDSWQLSGLQAVDALANNNADNPNSIFKYLDPFVGKAEMLPQKMTNATENNQQTGVSNTGAFDITTINLKWLFANSDITSEGTIVQDKYGNYGKIIKGYIGSADYGQQITLRVLISNWEFAGIRRPQGAGYQIMDADVRFFFTSSTDASSYSNYQVIIRETVPELTSLTKNLRNELFFPDDIDINKLKVANYPQLRPELNAVFNNKDYPYRIKWDEAARIAAKTNIEARGRFYLSDNNQTIKMRPAVEATYQYEKINISQLDLGYGYGAENYAMFVLNPFDPVFNTSGIGDKYVSTAQAKGFINQEQDKPLGAVTIYWTAQGETKPPITNITEISKYLKGGVFRGYKVTVAYKTDTYTYKQDFNIMLVFIDVSPTVCPSVVIGSAMPNFIESGIKSIYELNTYAGILNPYRDAYTAELMGALNTAAANFMVADKKYSYQNIVWETAPTTITQDRYLYSQSFSVNNINYVASIVRIKLTVKP